MDLIIRQAKINNRKELVDIGIHDGKFVKIATHIDGIGAREINANGNLISPPFIESHVHLDDALSVGIPRFNQTGTLQEAIEIASERKKTLTKSEVKENAEKVITWLVTNGVLKIRAHTDFSPDFTKLESILEVKESLKDIVDIQVVAFPQEGVLIQRGAKELFEEAVNMGVDVVGGLPQAEITREDGIEQIRYIFELAEKHDKLIDIHTDETGDAQSRYLEVIAKYARHFNMPGRVTASHTTALHNYQNDYAAKVISHVKQAEVNIVTNPFSNAILQNRLDGYPKYRGVTRVDELLDADVNVSIGNDNIMDPFGPLGKGSMLQAANLLAHTAHLTNPEQLKRLFQMITVNGAKTLADNEYGIQEGYQADCILLDVNDEQEAIRLMNEPIYVIRKGKQVVETKLAKRTLQINNKFVDIDFK